MLLFGNIISSYRHYMSLYVRQKVKYISLYYKQKKVLFCANVKDETDILSFTLWWCFYGTCGHTVFPDCTQHVPLPFLSIFAFPGTV